MPGEVWELQEVRMFNGLKPPGGSPKELFTREISTGGELWELWKNSGRGVGILGAGLVALGKVWELWELDLSCLARFGSSRASSFERT